MSVCSQWVLEWAGRECSKSGNDKQNCSFRKSGVVAASAVVFGACVATALSLSAPLPTLLPVVGAVLLAMKVPSLAPFIFASSPASLRLRIAALCLLLMATALLQFPLLMRPALVYGLLTAGPNLLAVLLYLLMQAFDRAALHVRHNLLNISALVVSLSLFIVVGLEDLIIPTLLTVGVLRAFLVKYHYLQSRLRCGQTLLVIWVSCVCGLGIGLLLIVAYLLSNPDHREILRRAYSILQERIASNPNHFEAAATQFMDSGVVNPYIRSWLVKLRPVEQQQPVVAFPVTGKPLDLYHTVRFFLALIIPTTSIASESAMAEEDRIRKGSAARQASSVLDVLDGFVLETTDCPDDGHSKSTAGARSMGTLSSGHALSEKGFSDEESSVEGDAMTSELDIQPSEWVVVTASPASQQQNADRRSLPHKEGMLKLRGKLGVWHKKNCILSQGSLSVIGRSTSLYALNMSTAGIMQVDSKIYLKFPPPVGDLVFMASDANVASQWVEAFTKSHSEATRM